MSIRKIKANTARVEGDYIFVEEYSQQSLGGILGFFLGLMLVMLIDTDFMSGAIVVFLAIVIVGALFPEKVVREIPVADVVELKHYPDRERVTVVLDDERVKRKQSR